MALSEFKSLSSYEIPGRGVVYVIENPEECHDFLHFLNANVLIDGILQHTIGVERFAHMPPWRKGEPIGLLVD